MIGMNRPTGPTGPPVRLVIADVDGALVTQEKVLTARAAEAIRKRIEQIATIGDMPSDVLMFRKSGLSIAMGNASADVQREATFVTTSNEEEGFRQRDETIRLAAARVMAELIGKVKSTLKL